MSCELLAEPASLSLEHSPALAAKISREPLTTRASPPDQPTRVADHESVRRHILGQDRTGPDEGMLSNSHAADHHDPSTQSGALPYGGRQ
jgi:hypothetical protein